MSVWKGIKSFFTLKVITISSSAEFPALSPIPLIVHSTCLAPSLIAAILFAVARPKSLWVCVERITLSIFLTLFLTSLNILPNSSGKVYPTVSGMLIVEAPLSIAISIHLYKKSKLERPPSSQLHSILLHKFLA